MKVKYLPLIVFSILLLGLFWWFGTNSQNQQIDTQLDRGLPILVKLLDGNNDISFRGIASVDDSVVWVSGSAGVFGKTLDGGLHWVFGRVPGADSLELRDIELFDAQTAIVMSSGFPTRIYRTQDGGESWQVVYGNDDERLFLDGMDFCDDRSGVAYGDPIDGQFVILRTTDGGESWRQDSVSQVAEDGEAGFAASGSGLACLGDGQALFVSGGGRSRICFETDGAWRSVETTLPSGTAGSGAFSLALHGDQVVVVGGDYQQDTAIYSTTRFNRETEEVSAGGGLPYQSSVVSIGDSILVSIGTPGGFISRDGGVSWTRFTDDGMHTLVAAKSGDVVYAAGAKGRLAKIVFKKEQLTP